MTVIEKLRDKANSLPLSPGVYIMKDERDAVIYVGKSKRLKNRVTSYFSGVHSSVKTARMVSRVRDFDYIVCDTEIEALTLENTLIKKHTPKYNVKLKDAKSYPYIKITKDGYPRLTVTREREGDGGKYFGPYQSSRQAYTALETVCTVLKLPTCSRVFPKDIGKERPCIYREMERCVAPCAGDIDRAGYLALIKCAEGILDGNVREVKESLRRDMETAAEELEFERAAALRDGIAALDRLSERQKVVADVKVSRDVFALHITECEAAMALLSVREGALINKNEFVLSVDELSGAEDALSLIVGYYDRTGNLPREVMLDFDIGEDRELLSEYLSLLAGRKVAVRVPERGDGRALCDMALENAREAARQTRLEGEREDKNLKRLAELLGLSETPRRIEAYDISNIGDESIFASMVVYADGKLKKSEYRSFSIKTTEGRDDYGSMREALSRRLAHIGDGGALSEAPDLILLDGGRGQVSAVREVMREMGLEIPLFGMVKDDYHKTRAIIDERDEISIAREMGVYAFVYRLQEEAHRFAVKHTMGSKRKSMTRSSLEKIEGIGPKKARLILREMTLAEVKSAGVEALAAIKGVNKRDAERIYAYFHRAE